MRLLRKRNRKKSIKPAIKAATKQSKWMVDRRRIASRTVSIIIIMGQLISRIAK